MVWTFVKTTLLIGILTGLFFVVAYLLGLDPISAIILAALMNFAIYLFSDRLVLRMGGAKLVSEQEAPRVYAALHRLSASTGMAMPKVALVNSPIPNAFATGRSPNNSTVAVHTGLLSMVNDEELEGVLAHELSHVRNWDTLTMTIAATVAGAIAYAAQMGLFFGGAYGYSGGSTGRNNQQGNIIGLLFMLVLAPLAATLVRLAVSRTRELAADESGAKLSGKPLALASALEKIDYYAKNRRPTKNTNPALSSLYIINPLRGTGISQLFSTHPPTAKRIARLHEIAASMGYGSYYTA
ncbi:MAG TPA: zinc metalloprotease HtpX [Candidatus Acidoferrales bacterium]|nr:zinc metalloprotease HtpX [Candidatus Acidoferrales bacterium]